MSFKSSPLRRRKTQRSKDAKAQRNGFSFNAFDITIKKTPQSSKRKTFCEKYRILPHVLSVVFFLLLCRCLNIEAVSLRLSVFASLRFSMYQWRRFKNKDSHKERLKTSIFSNRSRFLQTSTEKYLILHV